MIRLLDYNSLMTDMIYKSIIDSSVKLFNRFGISKTAISDVADMAEVSRATIFNNFGSKDGLIQAVLHQKTDDFRLFIKKMINSSDTAAVQIRMILLERVRLLQSLEFITDRRLKMKRKHLELFFFEMNEIFIRRLTNILIQHLGENSQHKSIANNIVFILHGIEQAVFEQKEKIELKVIERDLDYFLKQLLPGGKERRI